MTGPISVKKFHNSFVNSFDGDDSYDSTPRQTPNKLYALTDPTAVKSPQLICWSEFTSQRLGLTQPNRDDIQLLAGNLTTSSMSPYAACYGGHQFGHWASQLGDGRAITLGELKDPRGKSWEIQLKGAGKTAYSRHADGRAVLRSSLREYLMSEAMNFLGIPTTLALSMVTTGEDVIRDMLYDGNPKPEPGAITSRVAPSFLRFGNFQLLSARTEFESLEKLCFWSIENHFKNQFSNISDWFEYISQKTLEMIIHWTRVGFVHGVMNTDNMSILGLTIDYGPFSMLDEFNTNFTPNTTDNLKRYAFGRQPSISLWNLQQLAMALKPITQNSHQLDDILENYTHRMRSSYNEMMSKKLGVRIQENHSFEFLITQLNTLLEKYHFDYTLFFQALIHWRLSSEMILFTDALYSEYKTAEKDLLNWLKLYQSFEFIDIGFMKVSNPQFILRNYHLHQAITELENGEDHLLRKLEKVIKAPYKVTDEFTELCVKKPDWAFNTPGCSQLSCSS